MTTARLAGIALAALALAGCSTTGTVTTGSGSGGTRTLVTTQADCPDTFSKGDVDGCSNSVCPIPVNVVWDGKACQAIVGAQIIKMSRGNNDALLRWWLPNGSKWEFREESSRFALPINFTDQNAPGLRDQFHDRNVVANGKAVHIGNRNSNKERYEYQIRVFKQGGGPNDYIDSTDPVIYNDF
jgi:hypothetical protein